MKSFQLRKKNTLCMGFFLLLIDGNNYNCYRFRLNFIVKNEPYKKYTWGDKIPAWLFHENFSF